MKKNDRFWSIASTICLILGLLSLGRVLTELIHRTASGRGLVLHIGSVVLWFAIAFLFSRRRARSGREEIPPSELAAAIQKKLALPYKYLSDKIPPDALMRFFRRTMKEGKGAGFTPILVPVEEALDRHLETLSAAGALPAAQALPEPSPEEGKAILDRRWRACFADSAEADDPPGELLGELAGSEEQIAFLSCQADGAPREALMLRLPTDQPWQAAAYIPVGGANGMPETEQLLAVCKYWYEKHGAVPAAIGFGVMEFVLPKVIDRAQVMDVAKEHFAFCPDRVRRDTLSGAIGEVADGLWQSTLWHFRWYGETGPGEAADSLPLTDDPQKEALP